MTGLSPGTIPTSNYVSHDDPSKSHHHAWLQAVLDRLVQHEPQALAEGSELRDLWKAVVETKAPAAAVLRHPNPLVGVPRFSQRDSAQLAQRDRTCFSSSCAMLLEAIKPGTLQGASGDDQYLAVVQRFGDTTDASAQLRALANFRVTARLVQNADFQLIEQQINRGIPAPCVYIHRGPVDRPTGSGHWLIVYGHSPTYVVVNAPWVEPDLIHGTTLNANGMGLRFSRQNFGKRWMVEPIGGGGEQLPLRPRRPLFLWTQPESTPQQQQRLFTAGVPHQIAMGPYETGFFLEACRLRGSSFDPYCPLQPEISGAVRAVSEVLAAEGLPDHARAELLERIASHVHAMEPALDEQVRRRRVERQLQRLLNS
jgi:hypothetical protein